ncbi:MAG: helix-turn-helix domain-containing protein [Propionivibrio sp.]|nr:helix-turn-helix domain-containing protein [Propionivibrio sp.]
MRITGSLTDDAVLTELGARIAGRRIEFQLTQAAVAEQAGIAKRTLERMEAGQTSQLATLIRVLRVLDAASGLDSLIPESGPRPMDLLKRKGKVRQRAWANVPQRQPANRGAGMRSPEHACEKP